MRTFAPGKLVLTGAYAVLEGAPAVVVAVDRGAYADSSRACSAPTPEVAAALEAGASAPDIDASAMFAAAARAPGQGHAWSAEAGATAAPRKLGLGASAAILVASIAAHEADRGSDLTDPSVRERLFSVARAAHAKAQGGGSGVDVAASVHGGALRYVVGQPPEPVDLPPELRVAAFACATSARTSELRGAIDRLAAASGPLHRACMADLASIAEEAASAIRSADAAAFVAALRRTARALARLGDAAEVGIVPAGFDALEAIAAREEASFSVSGAGGGDVAVYVGRSAPSSTFIERARALGLFSLDLSLDTKGVRIAPAVPAFAESPRRAS